MLLKCLKLNKPRRENACLRGFGPGRMYSHKTIARGLKFRIYEVDGGTHYVSKINALVSCAVTAHLVCAFVFAYAKGRFSHDAAQKAL